MKYFIRRVLFKVSLNKGLFKVAAVTKPVGNCTEPADPTRGGAGGEEFCAGSGFLARLAGFPVLCSKPNITNVIKMCKTALINNWDDYLEQ